MKWLQKIVRKRSLDWWIFTFLPLLVFGFIIFLVNKGYQGSILLLFTQQFYFYPVILSSTEIGIRFKMNLDFEEQRFKNSGPAVLVLIFSSILLGTSYLREDLFITYGTLLFLVSIFLTITSIWLSNQNEYSGVDYGRKLENEKIEGQGNFSDKVEQSTQSYKGVKIKNE